VRYQVLGPLRVIDGGGVRAIRAGKLETMLAVLLLRANQVTSMKELINETWQEDPPPRATAAVHVYISQLRKLLAQAGPGPIETRTPGYLLRVDPHELDHVAFERLVRRGRSLKRQKQYAEAFAVLEEALALWQGRPLSGLSAGTVISGFLARIDEERLECLEMHVELSMLLGRHRQVLSQLYGLIVEYPLHEIFYAQLMQVLYQTDRRADALRVYRKAWHVLDRELGLEPSRRLRELQHLVLAAEGRGQLQPAV
jgi:DNA-binding SARP family transcriptional activator